MKKILKKKLPGAEIFGVTVIVDKSLDKYSGKILFPKQHEAGMKMISLIDNLHEFTNKK